MVGSISWELSLEDTDLSVQSIELYMSSKMTLRGNINWELHGDDSSVKPTPGTTWKTGELAGSKHIALTAMMSDRKKHSSNQSTQLLPAVRSNADEGTTLRIEVKLQGEVQNTIF